MQELRLQATVLYTTLRKCLRIWVLTLTVRQLLFQVQVTLLFTLVKRHSSLVQRLSLFLTQTVTLLMKKVSTLQQLRKSRKLREAELRIILTTDQMLSMLKVQVYGKQLRLMLLFHVLHKTNCLLTTLRLLLQTVQ